MLRNQKPYHILVIEDNAGDFLIVEELITERFLNSKIVHVTNFKDAAFKIASADSLFDIVLLDLTLPDKYGQALVTEMMNICPSYPVIILTGFADIEFSIKSISQGISDYLLKDELTASTFQKSITYAIERKKSIALLQESERRYSDVFHLSPQPMWIFDPVTYGFCQVNEATIKLYGYTEEEFLNMSMMELKNKSEIPFATNNSLNDVKDVVNNVFTGQFRHYKKSGEVIEIEIVSKALVLDSKVLRLVIVTDVTEKNRFERTLAKAIIKTQEEERFEIGTELHDNVCQILATSKLRLGMLKENFSAEGVLLINQSKADLSLASKEIRRLSHRLAPAFYDSATLKEEFHTLLNIFHIEGKSRTELEFDETFEDAALSKELKLNFYRILQEHINNIITHANATMVSVKMLIHENNVKMEVSENGVGFDKATVQTGIGMANMKRRAALFGGTLKLESSHGKGCTLSVEIPLSQGV